MSELVVYTSFSFILDTFDISMRARYPDEHFHLVTHRDHGQTITKLIEKEVKAGERTADIVILPHWAVLNLQLKGLLKPYESPEYEGYRKEFYDPKGAWCAMALSPIGIMSNTNLINDEEAPKTLGEALDGRWRGKLAIHEVTDNSQGQMGTTYLTALHRILGEKRWNELIDKIIDMKPKQYDCTPEMALAVGRGQYYLAIPTNRACVSYSLDMAGEPLRFMMPTDVPYMVSFAPTIAMVAGGRNPNWAENAFNFALSEDWQYRVEGLGGKIPPRRGIASSNPVPEDAQYFPILEDAANIPKFLELLKKKLPDV